MWVCVTREWEVRSEALLRREVSLILSRSSELLKTTDTWTVPTRRATFIFSLWSFLFFLSLLCSWANFIGELYVCILAETLYQETRVCIRGDGWDQQQLLLSTAHGQHAFFFIFFLIIIFWFFDFFGNWPNTLRCRQRVAWEWARATKKVRGYATFCNLNHTCHPLRCLGLVTRIY